MSEIVAMILYWLLLVFTAFLPTFLGSAYMGFKGTSMKWTLFGVLLTSLVQYGWASFWIGRFYPLHLMSGVTAIELIATALLGALLGGLADYIDSGTGTDSRLWDTADPANPNSLLNPANPGNVINITQHHHD